MTEFKREIGVIDSDGRIKPRKGWNQATGVTFKTEREFDGVGERQNVTTVTLRCGCSLTIRQGVKDTITGKVCAEHLDSMDLRPDFVLRRLKEVMDGIL
jgi:hypothetical protein